MEGVFFSSSGAAASPVKHIWNWKLLYAIFIATGILFIVLRFLDIWKVKWYTEHVISFPTHQQYMQRNSILLSLQNMNLSDRFLMEPMCKELLEEVNRIKLNAGYKSKNAESARMCQPKTHIVFLKTHKTASSTVMNILFRFGETRNLTFAFPSNNMAQFYYPGYFAASHVEGFSQENHKTFHIMCHHMRFQLTEVEKVMPHDTFYFTILRNPVSLMESAFSYYKGTQSFSRAKSLENFLSNTSKFYKFSNNYAKNCMTFDLGYDHNWQVSTKHLKLIQQAVEITFDLVLITEYFDESLVLLKNALCWTFDDVLSFPLNSRTNNTKTTLSPEIQDKIKSWNQLDWQLYVYFNKTFWDRVHNFGKERMKHEVEELRRRRAQMSETCLLGEVDPADIKDKSLRPFQYGMARILGYNLKSGLGVAEQLLCQKLVTPELQYSDLLRVKQQQRTKKLVQETSKPTLTQQKMESHDKGHVDKKSNKSIQGTAL